MSNRELIKTLKDGDLISFRYRMQDHKGVVRWSKFGGMRAIVYGESENHPRVNIALSSAQQIKLLNNE